jgi:hypothetical protein
MDLSVIPQTALVNILHFVPMQQRLQQCALVSTSWAAAAAQACSVEHSIKYSLPKEMRAGHLG